MKESVLQKLWKGSLSQINSILEKWERIRKAMSKKHSPASSEPLERKDDKLGVLREEAEAGKSVKLSCNLGLTVIRLLSWLGSTSSRPLTRQRRMGIWNGWKGPFQCWWYRGILTNNEDFPFNIGGKVVLGEVRVRWLGVLDEEVVEKQVGKRKTKVKVEQHRAPLANVQRSYYVPE